MTVRAKANKHVTNAEIPSQYFNFYERWKIRVSAISDAGGRCSHCGIATHSHDFGVLTHKEAWLKDLTKARVTEHQKLLSAVLISVTMLAM